MLFGAGHVYAVGVSGITSTVAVLDPRTGKLIRYLFNNHDFGDIYSIALRGNTLYVGGAVIKINGHRVSRIAAVNADTGHLLNWRRATGMSVDENVFSLVVRGDTIYLAGQFRKIDGSERRGLAALSTKTGKLLGWNPQLSGSARKLEVVGKQLYALGDFGAVGSQVQPYLARFR